MLKRFFLRDNLFLGIAIGLLMPFFIYGALLLVNFFIYSSKGTELFKPNGLYMLAVFGNLAPFMYYVNKPNLFKTSKGILICTFIFVIGMVVKLFFLK